MVGELVCCMGGFMFVLVLLGFVIVFGLLLFALITLLIHGGVD